MSEMVERMARLIAECDKDFRPVHRIEDWDRQRARHIIKGMRSDVLAVLDPYLERQLPSSYQILGDMAALFDAALAETEGGRVCPKCRGHGYLDPPSLTHENRRCDVCGGTGDIPRTETAETEGGG